MIKRLAVSKLNDKLDFDITFNEDLNILTGRNGSGKTTILKLLWYTVSGNLERIIPEVRFNKLTVETDKFELSLDVRRERSGKQVIAKLRIGDETKTKELGGEEYHDYLNLLNHQIVPTSEGSLFFPTFRRIEGGFSTYERENQMLFTDPSIKGRRYYREASSLQSAMSDFSGSISVLNHRFVASISTHDIIELLTQKYADVSEKTNAFHSELSAFITERIQGYENKPQKSEAKQLQDTTTILNDIQKKVDEV